MSQGYARVTFEMLGRPIRVREPQPRYPEFDARLVEIRQHALAVTSTQPSMLLPGLPTVAADGLPGYELVSIQGIFAPAKTPAAVIRRLNQEIVPFLQRADTKETFFNAGVESLGSTPEALAATVKSEMARLGKVIKDAGIRAE